MPTNPPLSVQRMKVPAGWNLMPLGAVCTSAQYGLSEPAALSEGNAWMVGMRHLNAGSVSFEDLAPVSLDESDIEAYELQPSDILFNRTNSYDLVGKTAIVGDDVPPRTVFASYLVRLHVESSQVSAKYVCLLLNSDLGRQQLHALITPGVSQFNINPSELLKRVRFPFPNIALQKKLVAAIESLESTSTSLYRLTAAKRKYKLGLTQQLLTGQRRFQEFVHSSEMQHSRYFDLPADWNLVKVAKVASEVSERNGNSNGMPVLSCTKHKGLVESLKYFGRQVFSDDLSNYKVVRRGQFAYATNHIEEGSIGLLTSLDAGVISPMYTVFETNETVHAPYLYMLFKTELFRHIFQANTNASVDRRGSLRWNEFRRLYIPLPSTAEQEQIAKCVTTCQREITLLEEQRDGFENQKKGLMQQLLTGKVGLPVDSALMEVPS